MPVLVAQRYPEQTWVLSIVESAFAVGLFVGSAVLVGLSDRLFGRRRTVLAGFAVLGAGFVGTGLAAMAVGFGDALVFTAASALLLALSGAGPALLLALSGAGLCMITTNTGSVRLLATPSSHRNRMVATWVLTAFLDLPDEELDDIYLRKFPHAFGGEPHETATARI
ncbi:hypothetical protein GCM10022295_51140 [Streptomyces osmaniensis]|uniref:MFS transporter n=1 Tax=Streptomyces osmaniensis TaxID=593134 RepID=A0ABP6X780_9ACTN